MKPIIYLANVKEDDLLEDNDYVKKVVEYANKEGAKVVKVCAKMEADLSDLNEEDKKEMLESVGIEESGLDKLIKATYDLLGIATYFTGGKDEVRAWTFKKGMNAKECAGIIHTDFEKGFIKAEVMSYEDLDKYGSELKVKEAGKTRLEGKDYLMQDGDICHFRFNV
jgi:GTP-binding protein YchF